MARWLLLFCFAAGAGCGDDEPAAPPPADGITISAPAAVVYDCAAIYNISDPEADWKYSYNLRGTAQVPRFEILVVRRVEGSGQINVTWINAGTIKKDAIVDSDDCWHVYIRQDYPEIQVDCSVTFPEPRTQS